MKKLVLSLAIVLSLIFGMNMTSGKASAAVDDAGDYYDDYCTVAQQKNNSILNFDSLGQSSFSYHLDKNGNGQAIGLTAVWSTPQAHKEQKLILYSGVDRLITVHIVGNQYIFKISYYHAMSHFSLKLLSDPQVGSVYSVQLSAY